MANHARVAADARRAARIGSRRFLRDRSIAAGSTGSAESVGGFVRLVDRLFSGWRSRRQHRLDGDLRDHCLSLMGRPGDEYAGLGLVCAAAVRLCERARRTLFQGTFGRPAVARPWPSQARISISS